MSNLALCELVVRVVFGGCAFLCVLMLHIFVCFRVSINIINAIPQLLLISTHVS